MTTKQTAETSFSGIEFETAGEAIQHANAAGCEAITIGGRHFAVRQAEASRLEADGVGFAYLHVMDHPNHPDGIVVTVPVN